MSDDLHREIGRLEEAVGTLKTEALAMRGDLAEIKEILAQAKGGWRTLIAVGTFAGMVGAAIVKAFAMLKGGAS